MRRGLAFGGGAVVLLVGLVAIAFAFMRPSDPVGWLDQNLERTDGNAWLSQDPPLVTAERLADAVEPASMVVDSWGIAVRYSRGTVTVVAGPREGTANVYWDGSSRDRRHYYFGRYRWWPGLGSATGPGPGPGVPTGPDGQPVPRDGTFAPLTPDAAVQTRRGEDFRGGGPGGGK